MNPVLKSLLKIGESVAIQAVPGGAMIDAAVHGIVDHSMSVDSAIPDLVHGAIQAVEAIKEADIADEAQFRAGVVMLDAGFRMVQQSLKHKDGTPAAPVV